MGMLLAFAPFVAFAVIDRLVSPGAGLIAGTAVSVALLLRDWLTPGRTPKLLEIGTGLLFAGLAAYTLAVRPDWSIIGVRLCVDSGLLLIVLATLALRRPFTLQYAREQVAPEFWNAPVFIRINTVITTAWAAAFAVLVAAELVLLFLPDVPARFGIIVSILALVAAFKFTAWYPRHIRADA